MNKPWLSVCVPTFNRAMYLEHLYRSIKKQNCDGVELMIVDDGSTDKTLAYLKRWSEFQSPKVRFVHHNENMGRAYSLRRAILLSSGNHCMIMDDDDYFVDGAINVIRNAIKKSESSGDQNLAGIAFLCINEDNRIIGDPFPTNGYVSNFYLVRVKRNITGDKKEIIRSNLIKKYLYPIYHGEKRVVTGIIWNNISYDYNCVFYNSIVAVKRYLPTGISKNLNQLRIQSASYSMEYSLSIINYPNSLDIRLVLYYSILFWKYLFLGGKVNVRRIRKSRFLLVIFPLLLAIIYYIKDKITIR